MDALDADSVYQLCQGKMILIMKGRYNFMKKLSQEQLEIMGAMGGMSL